MKRTLLAVAVSLLCATGFAQSLDLVRPYYNVNAICNSNKELTKNPLPKLSVKKEMSAMAMGTNAPRRSASTGTYYTATGGMYVGFDAEGNGYGYSIYNVAPFTKITFEGSGTGDWHINGYDLGTSDANLEYQYEPNYWMYAPTLVNQTDSFNIGDNNLYGWYGYNGGSSYASYQVYAKGIIGTDSVCTMFPCDDHTAYMYSGKAYSNVSNWGALDSDNLYGSGNIVIDGVTYYSYGALQPYKALASPLAVERLILKGVSSSAYPLAEGDTLTALIATEDEIIDTLYATADDIDAFTKSSYTRNSKTIYEGNIPFYKKVVDAFGNESVVDVTIPADVDFDIYILGFAKSETIDFGCEGLDVSDEDTNAQVAYFLISDGEKSTGRAYQIRLTLNLGIEGIFDKTYLLTNDDFSNVPEGTTVNALRVSEDGQTCTTDGQEESGSYNIGAVIVGTENPWFDNEGNENYEISGDADWITGIKVDTEYYDDTSSTNNWYGFNFVAVECDALPAGVTGRAAKLTITGRGVESVPFYVLQGDATIADGINYVQVSSDASNAKVYSVAGQQVPSNFKGIVIKNGKKYLNK